MASWVTESVAQTEAVGASFAPRVASGGVIALYGGLGMGKTAFVRGLAAGLGLQAGVSSPTFALMHDYGGKPPLVHFDMYRVSGFDELYSTGFFDYLEQDGVLYIEWSENIEGALPAGAITLTLERVDDDTRQLTIEGERF